MKSDGILFIVGLMWHRPGQQQKKTNIQKGEKCQINRLNKRKVEKGKIKQKIVRKDGKSGRKRSGNSAYVANLVCSSWKSGRAEKKQTRKSKGDAEIEIKPQTEAFIQHFFFFFLNKTKTKCTSRKSGKVVRMCDLVMTGRGRLEMVGNRVGLPANAAGCIRCGDVHTRAAVWLAESNESIVRFIHFRFRLSLFFCARSVDKSKDARTSWTIRAEPSETISAGSDSIERVSADLLAHRN